jgi:PKD repeat protein
MTTTSNKISSLKKRATSLTLMMMTAMVASTLFAAPSLSMAQQTNTGTATVTTPPPLTPEEQQRQERLHGMIAATTRNLIQGQKQVDGLVYTPRWSNATWVEPGSLSIAFAYCLPGEFAESGQHILGNSDLEVLESYVLAVTNDISGWLIVVENENQTNRLPAAVGAICSSDANVVEARIASPQEQIVINNIIKQFITIRTTQINNINQVINIINNVTTNGTGGGPTPPTNDTGGNDTGGPTPPPANNTGAGGGNTTDPLTVQAVIADIDQDAQPGVGFETSTDGGTPPYTCHWDLGDDTTSDTCSVSHIYQNPGTYTATVTVTDSVGQTASDSTEEFSITNTGGVGGGGNNRITVEEPPVDEPTTTDDTGAEATPPTNDTGGQ